MSIKDEIKRLFKCGRVPTQRDFDCLIDFSVNADNIDSGKLANERLPENISVNSLEGNGEKITHLNANHIEGVLPGTAILNIDASKITSGNLTNDRLPQNISVNGFTGDGSTLTNISASNINSGLLDTEYLPVASETNRGISRFASIEETQLGEAHDKNISPKLLSLAIEKANQNLDDKLGLIKAGLKFRDNVQVVATESVDMSTASEIDGYELQDGDRVLLTQQEDPSQNTVWIANSDQPWDIAEDVDNDIEGELAIGISVEVMQGDKYANSYWSIAAINNGIVWKKRTDLADFNFGHGLKLNGLAVSIDDDYISNIFSITVGDGLVKTGQQIAVDTSWFDARVQTLIDSAIDILSAEQAQLKQALAQLQKDLEALSEDVIPAEYTFTNAGATGRQGPNQSQINNEYANTSLASMVTVVGNGIQKWRVPKAGRYFISAEGAQGCVDGAQGGTPQEELGRGAKMSGYFMLNEGQILWILVGQHGEGTVGTYGHGGGGGGTFVATGIGADQSDSTALIVAGGGGAIGHSQKNSLAQGQITTNGASGYAQNTENDGNNNLGGVSGGAGGRGGKGFNDTQDMDMDAAAGWSGSGATSQSFLAGGLGAAATKGGDGGFGGGGALRSNEGYATAAGGGGYSGGGASDSNNGWTFAGGGGGSVNTGTDQVNEIGGAEAGHGKVVIMLK